jgi:glutamate--cysteine ligase catalytic subunit
MRRGEKVCINVPVYPDEKTPKGYLEDLTEFGDDGTSQAFAQPGHIYMDAMGFGMGLSCLQVTFQACNIREAEQLYDQLSPLCPILLALTASSPILRGFLADTGRMHAAKYLPKFFIFIIF